MKRFNVYVNNEFLGFVIAKNFAKAALEADSRWPLHKHRMVLSLVASRGSYV